MSKHLSFVYVVGVESVGPVKVGVTSNVARRVDGIQTGCPLTVKACGAVAYPSRAAAFEAERAAHRALHGSALRGEWFDVSPAEALRIVEMQGGEPVACDSPARGVTTAERRASFESSMLSYLSSLDADVVREVSKASGPECGIEALVARRWQQNEDWLKQKGRA